MFLPVFLICEMYTMIKSREELKLSNYRLCYIDEIPQTYIDDTPETKAWKETEEFARLERKEKERREYALKTYGSYSPDFNSEYWTKWKTQDYPNPEYIPGQQTHYAYFTSKELKDQWGDDWNDRPYDCNAGIPYDDKDTEIIMVPFYKPESLMLPHEICGAVNCAYSVEDINSGAVAWLYDREHKVSIQAGITPNEFFNKLDKIKED